MSHSNFGMAPVSIVASTPKLPPLPQKSLFGQKFQSQISNYSTADMKKNIYRQQLLNQIADQNQAKKKEKDAQYIEDEKWERAMWEADNKNSRQRRMYIEFQAIQNLKETKAKNPHDEAGGHKIIYRGIHASIRSLPDAKKKKLTETWGGSDQPRIQIAPKKEEPKDQLPSILEDIGNLGEQDLRQLITDYGEDGSRLVTSLSQQVEKLRAQKEKIAKEIQEKQHMHLKERIRKKRLGSNKVIPMHEIAVLN